MNFHVNYLNSACVQSVELDAAGGRKRGPGRRIESSGMNQFPRESLCNLQERRRVGGGFLKGPAEPIDGFGHQKK